MEAGTDPEAGPALQRPEPSDPQPLSSDLPFEDRLFSFLQDPYVQRFLDIDGTRLAFPVRLRDLTKEMQAAVDQYVNNDGGGHVVLRSPGLPESEEDAEDADDPFGRLSVHDYLGIHGRYHALSKSQAKAHPEDWGFKPVTLPLRSGDLLRRLPRGITPPKGYSGSESSLLLSELRLFDPNYVTLENGFPNPHDESLPEGSPDILEMRKLLRKLPLPCIPGDLADAVFLERDCTLELIDDPSQLRAGQKVVLVVDGGAVSQLVGKSLEPTWNPMKWFYRLFRFGSLTRPSPSAQAPLLGAAQGYGHGPTEVLLSHVASIRESTAERSALLAESEFYPSFREFSVTRPTEGPLMLSYTCVEPRHSSMDDPPTFYYELKPSNFRLYGLKRKEKDAPSAV